MIDNVYEIENMKSKIYSSILYVSFQQDVI